MKTLNVHDHVKVRPDMLNLPECWIIGGLSGLETGEYFYIDKEPSNRLWFKCCDEDFGTEAISATMCGFLENVRQVCRELGVTLDDVTTIERV